MSSTAVQPRPKVALRHSIADERNLADEIVNRLESRNGPIRTQLRIEVQDDVVTLSGVATSFYQKQIWLHAAWTFPGIKRVVDCIEVHSSFALAHN